jgi:hypothetical protein
MDFSEGRRKKIMMLDEFLSLLDHVTPRGSRYMATCAAHPDRSPSLQVTPGDTAISLKCWAGCSLMEICQSLGIDQRDLFFDALDPDPHKRRAAAQQRDRQRQQQATTARKQGRRIDALKTAEYHIRSRRELDIREWDDQQLDNELNVLADAYALLASEERDG